MTSTKREKFDGLFLESGAVRASKKSDVEMNTADSLLSDAAPLAHQTFWEILGLMLPMQLSTYLCNIRKTHLFLKFCLVPRGPRWWDLLIPSIQGYSWLMQPSQVSPASCLSGYDLLRNLCLPGWGYPWGRCVRCNQAVAASLWHPHRHSH